MNVKTVTEIHACNYQSLVSKSGEPFTLMFRLMDHYVITLHKYIYDLVDNCHDYYDLNLDIAV